MSAWPGAAPDVLPDARPASRSWVALAGILVAAVAWLVFFACAFQYHTGRAEFFYLADAFLHGRVWLEQALGPQDTIFMNGHVYVPFAPFPAFVVMPIVALIGPAQADHIESIINSALAAGVVGLAWWAAGRVGVERIRDRFLLVVLLGFSTQILWVTTRGGVWHTGHLVAAVVTLLLIGELFGKRRPVLLGLLVGAAFLTRAPVVFAGPVIALWLWLVPADGHAVVQGSDPGLPVGPRSLPWKAWFALAVGVLPALGFFAWYNAARFGTPFESGYGLATLMGDLVQQRERGLFSIVHIPMNADFLFFKLPTLIPSFPFLKPDGYGMSVFVTSPGLLLAFRAPWRDRRSWLLAAAAGLVLVPTLLYYGGGFFQYGYRYFLDSIPFVWALMALGVVHLGSFRPWHHVLVWAGVAVMAIGVYWAYNL